MTSLGTFYLTALGVEILNDLEHIKEKIEYEKIFYLTKDQRLFESFLLWQKAVKHTIEWHKEQRIINDLKN